MPDIIQQLLTQINSRVQSRLQTFRRSLSNLLEDTLNNSREVQLITNDDKMRGQLGVSTVEKVRDINRLLADDIRTEFQPFRLISGRIAGFVKSHCIHIDLQAALESPSAYEFIKVSASNWPWFEWLTMHGDQVIANVHYLPVSVAPTVQPYSRTRQGIMAAANRKGWNVPPDVSGTRDNNYVRRALDTSEFRNHLQLLLFQLIG